MIDEKKLIEESRWKNDRCTLDVIGVANCVGFHSD